MLDLAVKRFNSALWPYPIITSSGELAADALVSMAGNNSDRLTKHTNIGMDQLLKNQRDEACPLQVREHGNKSFVEYILASIELSRIESGGPIKQYEEAASGAVVMARSVTTLLRLCQDLD
jgi:hypothetical protein